MSRTSYDKVRVYERALHQLASWDEGVAVTGAFDEPCAARVARLALASMGVAPPKPVFTFGLSRSAAHKLTHAAEVDGDGVPTRALCGRVKASSLARHALFLDRPPTCHLCAWRLSCRAGSP